MKKISIIGAGQLGSRHLQGLKAAKTEMEIWVIDANDESLDMAKNRYDSIESHTSKVVHYAQSIDVLPQNLDLVIIATGSKPRANIVKSLLAHSLVKYLVLEKFLFTRMQDFGDIETLLKAKDVKCWVNCPRRMWPIYEDIRRLINQDVPVNIEFRGKNWGMCSNSVHYVDLWMYLSGDSQFDVDLRGVEPFVIESKRKGYIELIGNEVFCTPHHDMLNLSSLQDYNGNTYLVIRNDGNEILVDEGKAIWLFNGIEHAAMKQYQSGLTGILVDEIFASGECRLSTYSVSAQYQKLYLKAVMQFVNKIQGGNSDSCPIT